MFGNGDFLEWGSPWISAPNFGLPNICNVCLDEMAGCKMVLECINSSLRDFP